MVVPPAPIVDPALTSQCLDLCQTLSSKGLAFSIHIKISDIFSFSLETKGIILAPQEKKRKTSPSQRRRSEKRQVKFFEAKKASNTSHPSPSTPSPSSEAAPDLECDQCDYKANTWSNMLSHMRRTHVIPQTDGAEIDPVNLCASTKK